MNFISRWLEYFEPLMLLANRKAAFAECPQAQVHAGRHSLGLGWRCHIGAHRVSTGHNLTTVRRLADSSPIVQATARSIGQTS